MSYEEKVRQQIKQYQNVEDMHSRLDISEYYKSRFTRAQTRDIFRPAANHWEFYAFEFAENIKTTGNGNILSIGSGDGKVEIGVAERLLSNRTGLTVDSFTIELTDLSPHQIARARSNVEAAGLSRFFTFTQVDLNQWSPVHEYAGVMAHHSLHHIENLEGLFEGVRQCLLGTFCSMDMIGRNGHMRWPEVLKLVELFWDILPEEKKRHYVLPNFEKGFIDHDCSTQGFEGIRAQDILPCLITRFGFKAFYATGGLIDVFIGRGFGSNYDAQNPWDRAFIDLVGHLNAILIEAGCIKPTQMFARMTRNLNEVPIACGRLVPDFCVRRSD